MNCPICSELLAENYTSEDIDEAVETVNIDALTMLVDSPPYRCDTDSRSFWPSEVEGDEPDPIGDAKAHVATIREMMGENSPQLPVRMIELG